VPDIPFQTQIKNNNIELIPNKIHVSNKNYHRIYVYLRAGWHISKAKFVQEKPLQGSEEKIIQQIHTIRFNKTNPYVITGGHFYQLFVRNLGIFFNALLDRRISCTDEDWLNRQTIALRTVALDLEVFRQTQKDYTTIIPIRENLFSCFNFYARPSDSLFAILYTLLALTDEKFIETIFPMSQTKKRSLQTKNAGHLLYKNYKTSLKKLIQIYFEDVIDGQTGLVKKNLLLASARDGIKRESSFYDNVIAWATIRLANKLDLYQISDSKLESWRKKIIQTFWNEKEGIFLDDLSEHSRKMKLFSADSFIVLSTEFLKPNNAIDKKYLLQMAQYVKKNKFDVPLPLHYSKFDIPEKLYRPVRHLAPSYMGTSIWSHWGMEYIKTLIYLGQYADAKKHLDAYKRNIETYGGYPELYDKKGNLLHTRLYRGVLHNGWVINYEQTKMLYDNAKK